MNATDPAGKSAKAKRRGKHQVFLIAIKRHREQTHIYAVLSPSPADALATVKGLAVEATRTEVAGKLTKRLARSLKLKPGEPRLI